MIINSLAKERLAKELFYASVQKIKAIYNLLNERKNIFYQ